MTSVTSTLLPNSKAGVSVPEGHSCDSISRQLPIEKELDLGTGHAHVNIPTNWMAWGKGPSPFYLWHAHLDSWHRSTFLAGLQVMNNVVCIQQVLSKLYGGLKYISPL